MYQQTVVLITGASSGFGRLAAERLGRAGYRVFGTSRKPKSDHGDYFDMLPLDVQSDDSVQACVQEVMARAGGRIDVLINNAGYGLVALVEESPLDKSRQQFETNFWGTVRMTAAVLPIMRKQRAGRIINIGSLCGLIGSAGLGFYCATKFAIEGFSETLWQEVSPFGIRVSLIEPGWFKTGFGEARDQPSVPIADYDPIRGTVIETFDSGERAAADPNRVARMIQKVIEAPRPRRRYRIGTDSVLLPTVKTLLPEWAFAWATRRWFGIPKQMPPHDNAGQGASSSPAR